MGTLEESKCGVSDYVHMLVDSLRKEGHSCVCVAINDIHILDYNFTAYSARGNGGYNFYRFSSSLTWKLRLKELKKIIKLINPNLVSLQYVPYSFDNKGLPLSLFMILKEVVDDIQWHIMAHELWTMPDRGFLRHIISRCQKLITIKLFKLLHPQVIHVSNYYYKDLLSAYGISSSVLPLFSNIPVIPGLNHQKNSKVWTFVFFGTVSPTWRYSEFFRRVDFARSKRGIDLCRFCLLGSCGEFADILWLKLEQEKISLHFEFIRYGFLPEAKISYYLQLANFGVTTMPFHLVDKSGGVAAMVAHNLSIIITNISQEQSKCRHVANNAHHYIPMDDQFEERLSNQNCYHFPVDQLRETANQFISDVFV